MTTKSEAATLSKLREPFAANQISKLPKPTKKQTEDVRADFKKGIRCAICGSWHHPDVIHLDYVGHAALTDRLLDTDPEWSWEPLATTEVGLPAFDQTGGLWIRLTVLGVSRLGYGCADGKSGGDAVKEIIGDALRNAGMRFGAALDLWHKGDLHAEDGGERQHGAIDDAQFAQLQMLIEKTNSNSQAFCEHYKIASVAALPKTLFDGAATILKKRLAAQKPPKDEFAELNGDDIPY